MIRTMRVALAGLGFTALLLITPTQGGAQTVQANPVGVFIAGGTVLASAQQSDGKIIIGGNFQAVNGVPRHNIARLNTDGSVDSTWIPSVSYDIQSDTQIRAIAASANTIYVAGFFTSIGDEPRMLIGAIDATTGNVTPWNPGTADLSSNIAALAVSADSSTVFVGGRFSSLGGAPQSNLAAISAADGGALPAATAGPNDFVNALTVAGNLLYVGGSLTQIGNQAVQNLAAVDITTGNVTAWAPLPDSPVTSLIAAGSVIYAAGSFRNIGGQARQGAAAIDSMTGLATAWNPVVNFYAQTLAVSADTIYIGGSGISFPFTTGQLIAVDASLGNMQSWSLTPDGPVISLLAIGDTVLAGGRFTHIGGNLTGGLGRLNAATSGSDPSQLSAHSGYITSLQTQADGKIILGGTFTAVADVPRNNIARLNADGNVDLSWDPGSDNDGSITSMLVHGDVVYVGGYFNNIGQHFRPRLAALDLGTGVATSWQPDPDGAVMAIAAASNAIYAGGGFQHIGNAAHMDLAALDPLTGLSLIWDAAVDGPVSSLAIKGGTLYAGGMFDRAGGQARSNIVALDTGTATATSWDPSIDFQVNALVLNGNNVYAGGSFYRVGGMPHPGLVAIDATAVQAQDWSPTSINNGIVVSALALIGQDMAVWREL